MIRKLLPLVFLCISYVQGVAQNRTCHTMESMERLVQEDPSLINQRNDIESFTQYAIENNLLDGERAIITIPVVVHVVYNTSAQNISDAQILSQIDVLNKDFRKQNTDWSSTPSLFSSLVADCEINFCLATTDPNGASTTGITRTSTTVTSFIDNDYVKYTSQGGRNAWPAGQYLNLWVCNLNGFLGYAQFPGGPAATDGVVITYTAFGTSGTAVSPYNKGRTATHEVGHWLNLFHIWGDDGTACTGTDNVSDTPNQADENYGCPTYPTPSCSNTSDMYMNYMDYSNDACMYMFSTGQKSRMQALFISGGAKASLVSSAGCSGTSSPTYCNAAGSNTQYEWISKVSFNTINNTTSANGGYGNFTTISTTVNKGSAYTLSLTPGFSGTAYSEYFKVYIDYNNDKDFADAGELVYTSAATTAMVSTSITIPTTATTGTTRMRVIMRDGAISGPCEIYTYGEVEDYSISIQSSSSCAQPGSLVSSSITSSSATLSWAAVSGAASYTVGIKPSTSTTYTYYTITSTSYSATGLTAGITYNWQVRTNCSGSSSSYTNANFTTLSACTDNYETNETFSAAKPISVNVNTIAKIGTSTDIDWFKFSNTSTSTNIKVQLTNLPADYELKLYNSLGTLLYSSTNGSTTSETITYNNAPVGTYYIKVYGYNGAFSSSSCYTLRANIGSALFKLSGEDEIDNIESSTLKSDMLLYPNPTFDGNTNIEIVNDYMGAYEVAIFDATGKTVIMNNGEKTDQSLKLMMDVSTLSNGVYSVIVRSQEFQYYKKLIITR